MTSTAARAMLLANRHPTSEVALDHAHHAAVAIAVVVLVDEVVELTGDGLGEALLDVGDDDLDGGAAPPRPYSLGDRLANGLGPLRARGSGAIRAAGRARASGWIAKY